MRNSRKTIESFDRRPYASIFATAVFAYFPRNGGYKYANKPLPYCFGRDTFFRDVQHSHYPSRLAPEGAFRRSLLGLNLKISCGGL